MSVKKVKDIIEEINEDLDDNQTKFKFIQPSCRLSRDNLYFKDKNATDVCGQNRCSAQVFCHPYSLFYIQECIGKQEYPLCGLTREMLLKNNFITTNGLCILCLLNNKVCCLAALHPDPLQDNLSIPDSNLLDLIKTDPAINLVDALHRDLAFKIPISKSKLKSIFKFYLQQNYDKYFTDGSPWIGESALEFYIDSKFSSYKTETDVYYRDFSAFIGLYRMILRGLDSPIEFNFNYKDISSFSSARPNATFLYNNAHFMRVESKLSDGELDVAAAELTQKLFAECYDSFPDNSNSIIGIASTASFVSIFIIEAIIEEKDENNEVTYLKARRFESKFYKTFNINEINQFLIFFIEMIKILRWVITINGKVGHFHLSLNQKITTPNQHQVEWNGKYIKKWLKFSEFFTLQQLSNMRTIFEANPPLKNIESGKFIGFSDNGDALIHITSVRFKLSRYLESKLISANDALAQIDNAILELEKEPYGFAHCDLQLDNIYVVEEYENGKKKLVVVLDDLEFLTKINDPAPPQVAYCRPIPVPNSFTALDLHKLQYAKLRELITSKYGSSQPAKRSREG